MACQAHAGVEWARIARDAAPIRRMGGAAAASANAVVVHAAWSVMLVILRV